MGLLLTESEISERLRVTVSTVRRWRRLGCGPHFVRLGRCVRYALDDLTRYIEQHTCTSTRGGGSGGVADGQRERDS